MSQENKPGLLVVFLVVWTRFSVEIRIYMTFLHGIHLSFRARKLYIQIERALIKVTACNSDMGINPKN